MWSLAEFKQLSYQFCAQIRNQSSYYNDDFSESVIFVLSYAIGEAAQTRVQVGVFNIPGTTGQLRRHHATHV